MLEFVVHRSAYQLKEADPHSWALPRLTGVPKAAMVEIQADEYGGGNAERMHSALFAKSMDRLGLDARYGAYLDRIPGVTLATVNLMSLLGLHRRWRGALVGHLALFEMSSSVPNRRYGNGLRRLGCDRETTDFFDEHVTADAVHEAIAAVDLAGGLVRQDPALSADVIWGARALVELEGRFARRLLDAWAAGPLLAAGATRQRLTDEILRGRWSQCSDDHDPGGHHEQGASPTSRCRSTATSPGRTRTSRIRSARGGERAARVGARRPELARDPRPGGRRAQRRLRRHRGAREPRPARS